MQIRFRKCWLQISGDVSNSDENMKYIDKSATAELQMSSNKYLRIYFRENIRKKTWIITNCLKKRTSLLA